MGQAVNDGAVYFDNTRVSTFFKCPRSYYFRHVRHWETTGKRTPLIFGGAMHAAMDVIWTSMRNVKDDLTLTEMAATAFNEHWTKEGMELQPVHIDEKRNPGLAKEIIMAYIQRWRGWISEIEVLAVEQPFVIPLSEVSSDTVKVYYIGRMDKLFKDKNAQVFVSEHKTTSLYRTQGVFASEFIESFSPDSQVDGYAYASHAIFGDNARGVMVDAILVHKLHRGFTHIPILRQLSSLDAWYWDVQYYINEILQNLEMLEESRYAGPGEDAPFMMAFPKRTEHCFHKYGSCPFLSVCKYGDANPERIVAPPENFTEHIWDPFEHNVAAGQEIMIIGSGLEGTSDSNNQNPVGGFAEAIPER